MKTFLAVLGIALLLSVAMTPWLIALARRHRLVDEPGARKVHRHSIPRIGGIAIVVPTVLATVPVLLLNNGVGHEFRAIQWQVIAYLVAGLAIFAMGLADDLRGLRARTKFLVQIVAACAIYFSGTRIDHIAFFEFGTIDLGPLAFPLTVLWIVGVTNAVNLIDGLDGLAGGIAAITCGVLAMFALVQGDLVMSVLMLGLLGSLIGFLFFNFNPARIFMGDSGSQYLGFSLAAASVLTYTKASTAVALALPVLALGVPIFDTLLSMLRRFLGRRSLFAPDRGHIHHRLLDLGLGHRGVVLLIYLVTTAAAAFGVVMTIWRDARTLSVFVVGLLFLVAVFRACGVFRVRGSFAKLAQNREILRREREARAGFENALNEIVEARSFTDWWSAVCRAGDTLEFSSLRLLWLDRGGLPCNAEWSKPSESSRATGLTVEIPIKDRREGQTMRLVATVQANGSLEEAGRRVSLLARLLDEGPTFQVGAPARANESTEAQEAAHTGEIILPPAWITTTATAARDLVH